jgi:CHRD domain
MKKHLLTLAISCLAAASLRADIVYQDSFNYFDGPIVANGTNANGTTNWFHTGTATASDFFIRNHRAEISASPARVEDVHCNFSTFTNTQTILYSSFTVNCTSLPPAAPSTYFAHFYVNSSTFHARVFAMAGSLANTWRLGISGVAGSPTQTVTIDLATNINYQVVTKWNPTTDNTANDSFGATLWVNPITSDDLHVVTGDTVQSPAASVGYGFRQASGFGTAFLVVTNLAVATTFEEAAQSVWPTNAVAPAVVYQPTTRTNFVSDQVKIGAVVAGQSLAGMAYQWSKDGTDVAGQTANVLTIAGAAVSDTGNYQLRATTPFGLSATSAVAFLWVTNPPVPPTIVSQPGNTNVFNHQNVSLKVVASGPPTLGYQWFLNNNALVDGPNFAGANSDTLLVTDILAGNGTTGTYRADVSNPFGTTSTTNFVLNVTNPPAVSIAYLRTLVDGNFIATNTTQLWQVTGTVTTFTNLTSVNTSSYYIQDATAGINMFVTFGQTFRPQLGDVINLVGFMSSFQGNLELEADTVNNPATSYTVLSNNLALLPAPIVIPYNAITNDIKLAETLEGSVVMLTNVFFTNAVLISTNANTTTLVTNASGQNFSLLFSSQDQDTADQTVPPFAYTVRGILTQNTNPPNNNLNRGYQLTVTKFSDIVTDPPPAMTLGSTHSGNVTALSWDATPYAYSYTVLKSSDVTGPYLPTAGYQARMLAANENPGNRSTGLGFGTVELSPDETTITVNMRFSGLTAAATAAHIHGPAGAGTNASVLFPFTGVPSATSGAIPQQTFAINPTQVGYLKNGLLYMNVHNLNFGGGELRAQLLPVSSAGLTFTNAAGFYNDRNATNGATFYRIVSP